jgi:hypothetical protein
MVISPSSFEPAPGDLNRDASTLRMAGGDYGFFATRYCVRLCLLNQY